MSMGGVDLLVSVVVRGASNGMGLRNPVLRATVPAGLTLETAKIDMGDPIDATALAQICTGVPVPAGGGEVVCRLPSPMRLLRNVVTTFRADDAGSIPESLTFTLSADNLPAPLTRTFPVE